MSHIEIIKCCQNHWSLLQALQQRDGSALLMKREVVIKEEPISVSACERESPGAQMFAEVGGPFQPPRASPDLAVGLFACDSDHEQAGWQ